MNEDQLELAVAAYFDEITATFRPIKVPERQIWLSKSDTEWVAIMVPANDKAVQAFASSVFFGTTTSVSQKHLVETMLTDPAFAAVKSDFGFGGSPGRIIQLLVRRSVVIEEGMARVDGTAAINVLKELRRAFEQEEIVVVFRTIIFGIHMDVPTLKVSDDISLKRLDEEEIRQSFYGFEDMPVAILSPPRIPLLRHNAEAQISFTLPRKSYSAALDDAELQVETILDELLDGLRLFRPGRYVTGPVGSTDSVFGQSHMVRRFRSVFIVDARTELCESDETPLAEIYALLTKTRSTDPVLSRAIDRFVMGRERNKPEDSVVDYVVAWESILLTTEGNSINQESSYRFSVNGASLLHGCGVIEDRIAGRRFMKSVYDVRSKIVHGSKLELPNNLKSEYPSLHKLMQTVESNLRSAILYLGAMPVTERPYRKPDGWEHLLWGK